MRTSPRNPAPPTGPPHSTRHWAHRAPGIRAALAVVAATVLLSGCMANPRPKPLAIASPLTPPSSPTATESPVLATPTPDPRPTPTPAQSRAPRPRPGPQAPHRITAAMVSHALGSAGIPALRVVAQPFPRTRVGNHTVIYTRAAAFAGSVPVDRVKVHLRATPVSYTWRFGDGATRTTSGPGAPYPRQTLTHVYRAPGSFSPTVTTTYAVRYRLPGRPWRSLRGTYTVSGPSTTLRVVRNP